MSSPALSRPFSINNSELIPLPYSFISITGEDAERFLQGQVSCDLHQLNRNIASYGTVNTPKGRIYGLFKIVQIDDGFLLRLEASCAASFLNRLQKYVVFFKANIQVSNQYKAFGLLTDIPHGPEKPNQTARNGNDILLRCHSKSPMFELWSDTDISASSQNSPESWFVQETLNGLPELYAETQEEFILQHLNLQHLGAVSFSKGCYTGQEIIARMKYLGKLKKKAYILESNALTEQEVRSLHPGADISDATGTKCGELVRCHWHSPDQTVALGILDTATFDSARQLSFGNTGPYEFQLIDPDYSLS